ncbi:ABC-type sugar transport system, permease component [Thermobacillus composti KWC4]|uniref:ABC-type sugar transport system, permease component n=1 Tax=Thermobacillus composti (strain DSM 18247 / JCM 13945 / KWC4) TaxID=717605 RepID=L0EHL0_THECK|nr:carbohydrate ABC transporter permease [Thermobacillus composti]AGA59282.1 ABC-type sugar transport system, permease component [Thermobacillus composti KWC4]
MKGRLEDRIFDGVNYLLLSLIFFVTAYPFYYLLVTSFNSGTDALLGGAYFWPSDFTLENYKTFFNDSKWLSALFMSIARTVAGAVTGVLFTCLVAYGLSHKGLVFSKVYFSLVIFAMYFSGGLIPYYVVLRSLGLLNSFATYIIPGMLNTFFLLIAISFFREIPNDLKESAWMDGASELKIFYRIILPISKPLIATMALFVGVGHWNSWLDSAYFVRAEYLRTLSYRLIEIINQSRVPQEAIEAAAGASSVTSYSLQVTAMIVSIAPIICVYPFLQKYFVAGIMLGSVKE